MSESPVVTYYGWSSLSIDTDHGQLFFDPFFRHYCGVQWFEMDDFREARYICVTHGHEEHFLDVPDIARESGATVIGTAAVERFLRKRHGMSADRLRVVAEDAPVDVPGFRVSAFRWQHRDINLPKSLSKAVFQGNTTQLAWAWSSLTRAPFYAAYTGYHVELPGGLTVLNYNEGFNTKMTDSEINALGERFHTDVLLAGMQLHFVDDVARGAKALNPRVVVLYPPHAKFHEMMGADSAPWEEFAAAVRSAVPDAVVVVAEPGTRIDARTGRLLEALAAAPA